MRLVIHGCLHLIGFDDETEDEKEKMTLMEVLGLKNGRLLNYMNVKEDSELGSLIQIVKKLRSPQGCPWDKKQDHDSLILFSVDDWNSLMFYILSFKQESQKKLNIIIRKLNKKIIFQ